MEASSGDDGSVPEAGTVVPGGTSYEAESMTNTLFGSAGRGKCTACASSAAEMPGGMCCSQGGEVHGILGHSAMGNGAIMFNGISAPADGMYDVDWWYFCGNSDTNGDTVCPWAGQGKGNPPGCRPAQFLINGTPLQMADVQFPCSAGPWSVVWLKTISMPLKAGSNNTIRFFSTGPDAPDLDRIVVHDGTSGGGVDAGRD